VSEAFYNPGAAGERARRIPLWRWALWYLCLGLAMVLFYVVLTPIWLGLRGAAWTAEFRARRKAS
jgi:hypothetical protein